MKLTSTLTLVICILAMVVCMLILNNRRTKRNAGETGFESAKKRFPTYDHAYTVEDTMFFYKGDSFLGKSVVVIE